jgi:hypothetical protein
MGLLRVTAVALVACSAAGADPAGAPSRERVRPESWKQLPSIAGAVGAAAKAEGVTIDAVDAWGDPANGCYAVWLALRGKSGDAPALADQVLAGLARAAAPRRATAPPAGSKPAPAERGTRSQAASAPAGRVTSQATSPSTERGTSQAAPAERGVRSQATSPSTERGARSQAGSASASALAISELVKPAGRDGVLSFAFASAPYRGRLRAQLGGGRIDAAACFGNQRAPLACDAACALVLEGTP